MISEHPLADAFNDIDTSDLCFSPHNSHWIPDLFEDIQDGQLSQDDLLTDAVSEIMKFKTEIPDLQLEEGTPSPTDSPQPKVESPGSHVHEVGQNVEIAQFPACKEEFDEFKTTLNVSQPGDVITQRSLFRNQIANSVTAPNGRVHFIVRPNPSVSLASKGKLGIDNPLYCNIRRLTPVNNLKNQNDNTEVRAKSVPTPQVVDHLDSSLQLSSLTTRNLLDRTVLPLGFILVLEVLCESTALM
ncbi:unnamed protein product [Echinostoma caproni]|uniref:Activating transcription factor 6 n=1 Tax=Echinostoma caproni TaxID=27848 RepID=A0A183A1F0_9TREM|nr:unnamed protein product [Echinostoma caproni]